MAGTFGGSKEEGGFEGAKKILRIEASMTKVEASKLEVQPIVTQAPAEDLRGAANRAP